MNNAIVAERVKSLMKQKGMKMVFLSQKLGIRPNYFTDCANPNKNITIPDTLLKEVAVFLDTTVAYLTGETDDPNFHLSSVGLKVSQYETGSSRPIIGHTSAGHGVFAEQDILGYEPVAEEYDTDEFFWLEVNGDSMAPTFTDGDLVLVHRDMPVESNTIMVVIIDDTDGVIKKVSIDEDSVTLNSFNPYYPPRVFGGSEISRLRFIGRVIEQRRKF